jgi:lipopolysaccharide/colanic/teichoic acid biosynthesis glycosyltransferase
VTAWQQQAPARQYRPQGLAAAALKRLVDVGVAALSLVALAPLLLALGVWIKLDSPGPVFFRQVRVGRHGRLFRIFKFRTMQAQQPAGGLEITASSDARITRAGHFLRRSKLDELPQLLDVLRGTMSLVGPRPEVPRYVAHYPETWRERLLAVRPGMTDFASVLYRHESDLLSQAADPERTYVEQILPSKLRYALQYVEHPGLGQDLRIIGLTLRTVFMPPPRPAAAKHMGPRQRAFWLWLEQAMSTLSPRNRSLAMLADAAVVLAAWHLTYLFRLGVERWQPGRAWYDDYVSLGVVACYWVMLGLAGVPRGLWRFFGFEDFKRIALACTLAGGLSAAAVLTAQLSAVARAVLVLHPVFCLLGLTLMRLGSRVRHEAL